MPWEKKITTPPHRCKTPRFWLSRYQPGSTWRCEVCDVLWVLHLGYSGVNGHYMEWTRD